MNKRVPEAVITTDRNQAGNGTVISVEIPDSKVGAGATPSRRIELAVWALQDEQRCRSLIDSADAQIAAGEAAKQLTAIALPPIPAPPAPAE